MNYVAALKSVGTVLGVVGYYVLAVVVLCSTTTMIIGDVLCVALFAVFFTGFLIFLMVWLYEDFYS